MNKISRHYTEQALTPGTLECKIAVYEDRIRGWFHDQARILEKASDHCGFVLLMVAIAYMEGHAIFLTGRPSKNRSKEFFRVGFKEVFSCAMDLPGRIKQDDVIDEIYAQVRCGLFHHGTTKGKVALSGRFDEPISVLVDKRTNHIATIQINPHRLLAAVEGHLSEYVTRLRKPDETYLRENFEKAWKIT